MFVHLDGAIDAIRVLLRHSSRRLHQWLRWGQVRSSSGLHLHAHHSVGHALRQCTVLQCHCLCRSLVHQGHLLGHLLPIGLHHWHRVLGWAVALLAGQCAQYCLCGGLDLLLHHGQHLPRLSFHGDSEHVSSSTYAVVHLVSISMMLARRPRNDNRILSPAFSLNR